MLRGPAAVLLGTAFSLAAQGEDPAVHRLVAFLDAPYPGLARRAEAALRTADPVVTVPLLVARLEEYWTEQPRAVYPPGPFGRGSGVRSALDVGNPTIKGLRVWCADAGRELYHDPFSSLVTGLGRNHPATRFPVAALSLLAHYGRHSAAAAPTLAPWLVRRDAGPHALEALCAIGPAAVPHLLALLRDPDSSWPAAFALGFIGTAEPLLAAFAGEDRALVAPALLGLATARHRFFNQERERAFALLAGDDRTTAWMAAWALSRQPDGARHLVTAWGEPARRPWILVGLGLLERPPAAAHGIAIAALAEPDLRSRAAQLLASLQLSKVEAARAVQILRHHLDDSDCIRALSSLGLAAKVLEPDLVAILADREAERLHYGALQVLGSMSPGPDAIAALQRALTAEPEAKNRSHLRYAAGAALGRQGTAQLEFLLEHVDAHQQVAQGARSGLIFIGTPAVVPCLRQGEAGLGIVVGMRAKAAPGLAAAAIDGADGAVEALARIRRHYRDGVASRCVEVLGKVPPERLPDLVRVYGETPPTAAESAALVRLAENKELRALVLRSLFQKEVPLEAAELALAASALDDDDPQVAALAMLALATSPSPPRDVAFEERIRRSLGHDDPKVREAGLWSTAGLGTAGKHLLPHIIRRLGDPVEDLRRQAVAVIPVLRPDLLPTRTGLLGILADEERISENFEVFDSAAVGGHPGPPEAWLQKLEHADPKERLHALETIFAFPRVFAPHRERVALLATDDPAAAVREYVVRHIPWLGWDRDAELLMVRCLKDNEGGVRAAAARNLARGDPGDGVIEALRMVLQDPESTVRIAAVRALGACKAAARDALPDLIATLFDRDPEVRAVAARATGRIDIDEPRTIKGLTRALEFDDARTLRAVLRTLQDAGSLDPTTKAAVHGRAHHPDPLVRAQVLDTLWATLPDDDDTLVLLVEALLEDEQPMETATGYLRSFVHGH